MCERDNCLITTSIDLFHSCFIRILHQNHPTIWCNLSSTNHLLDHGWIITFPLVTPQQNSIVFPRNCRNWKTFLPVAWPIWLAAESWGLADSCLFQDPSLTAQPITVNCPTISGLIQVSTFWLVLGSGCELCVWFDSMVVALFFFATGQARVKLAERHPRIRSFLILSWFFCHIQPSKCFLYFFHTSDACVSTLNSLNFGVFLLVV